ncbi:MAG: hypothetical protein JO344_18875 [Planctomycetaceae bacterium]|nr:hypothetical protein [Planctomycetaceae bacterium]
MATKPASTYILDSTNSLYTNMAGCWPMLEGSGTTTADKTSNARTATLTGGLTWGTPDSEGPNFQPSSGTEYLSLASNLVIPVNSSFSIAWACEIPNIGSDNSNTIMLGDVVDSGQNFIWMHSTGYVELWVGGLIPAGAQTLKIASSPATRHDYLLVAAYSSGSYTLTLYQDGTASTPITGLTAGTTAWKINAILNGYSSSGYSFYGQFEYMYIWSGRALASTDAATLSVIGGGNPYSILKAASSASFTVSPSAIPANHAGNLTLTLTGTGTSWTSGSTVTVQNSVTGTTTVTKGTWTQSSGTAATLGVTTGSGTGTFTITVDGVASPALTVDTASFTISPTSGGTGTTPTITATGTNTLWSSETAATLFSVSGGTGASISSISVTSNTAATFTLAVGSGSGTLTITDVPTGDTTSFTSTTTSSIELVSCVYPKTTYAWTDRTGITTPDVSGQYDLANLTQISTADAGTLVITADSTMPGAIIGLALVLWDERGNPISISNGEITTSGWAMNAAGNYIAANGYSITAGFLAFDVSNAAAYSILVIQISNGTVNLHSKLF